MFALKYELYKMELKENYQLFLKKLNQLGITIPKDVQTKDELKQYLCQLNSKK